MAKGKRDPVTHRTEAQAQNHRDTYRQTPEYKAKAKAWAANRKEAVSDGRAHKGDGKDVSHKVALDKGGSKTSKSNLTMQSRAENRGHGMGRNGTKPSAKTLQMRRRLNK